MLFLYSVDKCPLCLYSIHTIYIVCILYIYKQYAAAGACSARNLSRHFWAACGSYRVLYLQMKIKTHDGVVVRGMSIQKMQFRCTPRGTT